MGPWEVIEPGGSVEHWNEESGQVWMERLLSTFPHAVWINPTPEDRWGSTQSSRLIRQVMGGRMFPLTVDGLDAAMRELGR